MLGLFDVLLEEVEDLLAVAKHFINRLNPSSSQNIA